MRRLPSCPSSNLELATAPLLASLAVLGGAPACENEAPTSEETQKSEAAQETARKEEDQMELNKFQADFAQECLTVIDENGCVKNSSSTSWTSASPEKEWAIQTICFCDRNALPEQDICSLSIGVVPILISHSSYLDLGSHELLQYAANPNITFNPIMRTSLRGTTGFTIYKSDSPNRSTTHYLSSASTEKARQIVGELTDQGYKKCQAYRTRKKQ